MEILNFLLKINTDILHVMSNTHHIIIFSLLAYLIRYCTAACYDRSGKPITCITSPVNAALNEKIKATNTCGDEPEGYCYIGPQRKCEICNKNNPTQKHPAEYMVDKFSLTNITWWQSQTWWTSNQLGLSKMFQPLKVNITLDLDKKYLISGGIYVTFKTERPKQMIIERSFDFGKTWQVYQYYAKNCRSAYNLQPDPPINLLDPFKRICSEFYSGEFPRSGGVVHFDPRTRYTPPNYYNTEVHKYLEATNIRLTLEYPGTDGREYINEETTLNQYFYAISDLRVDARCDCNGHAEFCDVKDGFKMCDCKHFTSGDDCQSCLPMYRNRVWRAGNATHANPCEKCQCFDHAFSCTYNTFLTQGMCDNCQHNTLGVRCDQCVETYYRNISVTLNDLKVCIPCDCYQPGISDDGKCLQIATSSHQLGQCNCKTGIYGRKCDQCIPGKWGFVTPPIGTCFDCGCSMFGTLNNNQICDQYTGKCACKAFVTGRTCDTCKDGYYKFPTAFSQDCLICPCNLGGALPNCNKISGICSCKPGVTGPKCDRVKSGFFYPNFTHVKFEPEFLSANGSFTWYLMVRNYARFFTGLGYARLEAGHDINFSFTVPTTAKYFMLLRYSLYHLDWYSHMLPQGREDIDWSGSANMQLYLKNTDRPNQWLFSIKIKDFSGKVIKVSSFAMADLKLGDDNNWMSTSFVELAAGTTYQFTLTYESSSNNYGSPWPLLLDSFILTLDYNWATYYTTMSRVEIKTEIQKCYQDSKALATTYNLPSHCAPHVFTIDLQLYNRALACNCFPSGSFEWNSCVAFGGQCNCKIGYGGRRCDQCIPGYYGNPLTGCIPCSCSQDGSLSLACHQTTGQCTCKANAHGLKCDECKIGFYHLNKTNPKGCQECFGYGHLSSCTRAVGFIRSYVSTVFTTVSSFGGWRLMNPAGLDETSLLIKTSIGMEYTDEASMKRYFSAPVTYLGDQLYSYGQLLIVEMSIYPIFNRPTSVEWHVRLIGNKQTAMFKFLESISKTRTRYTVRLHQDYMLNITKMAEFAFKAMLGQLTALHIGVVYFEAPVTVTLKQVMLETALYEPSNTNMPLMLKYIEHARCLTGYKGLSCEACAVGYTRVIPNGGPLINCVPCACKDRSTTCSSQSGVCTNCRPGTTGRYCEKCLDNVMETECDRCKTGYWGLYTQVNGCKPCKCYLPGTQDGNNNVCDSSSGQCACNRTLNVGGRQCNICKENAYNISLGDELRCQECPVCYALIENSVLRLRQEIFKVQVEIATVVTSLASVQIKPFFQAITTMQMSVKNITEKANKGKVTLSGLDFLWKTLENKINVFLTTLKESTTMQLQNLLTEANAIFMIHNATVYQFSGIYRFLINSYNLLNNTVQARMQQQIIALNQLNKLAREMNNYVTMATTKKTTVLTKKYDLMQKMQLSINAAKQAADAASTIRDRAFNLTSSLTPIDTRGKQVEKYAKTCITSIETWLTNSTTALMYAQRVLASIAITIPSHSQNITALKVITMSLTNQFNGFISKLFKLSNDINAIALEITKLKTSLHQTQVSSAKRRSSLLLTNLLVLKNKTNLAVMSGLAVRTEASNMLNTVRNFMSVASQAQQAANKALAQVDTVKASVESALAIALSISNQIQGPKTTAATALQVMTAANRVTTDEKMLIDSFYQQAVNLRTQTQAALLMVQGEEIRKYINLNLNPLITQCTDYRTRTNAALASSQRALKRAEQAYSSAVATSQKISVLSANINQLQTVNTAQLDNLILAINRIKANYAALDLTTGITRLRFALINQGNKISQYRTKDLNLKSKINAYKLVYQSLIKMSC